VTGPSCEVCAKPLDRVGDLLCGDCSHAFTVMLELLHTHPEIAANDIERIKEVFEWRLKKIRPMEATTESGLRPIS